MVAALAAVRAAAIPGQDMVAKAVVAGQVAARVAMAGAGAKPAVDRVDKAAVPGASPPIRSH